MNTKGASNKNPGPRATTAEPDGKLEVGSGQRSRWAAPARNPYWKLVVVNVVVVALFFAAIASLGKFMVNHLDRHERSVSATYLKAMLDVTQDSVQGWVETKMRVIKDYAVSPEVLRLARAQLSVPRNRDALLASQALDGLRTVFRGQYGTEKFIGFFVIAPDWISVASMRDGNVGTTNLLAKDRPELLERAFRGEACFAPPVVSDVPLEGETFPTSMFLLAPLKNERDEVIAVLTFRLNPRTYFNHMAQSARFGETGETYFFDSKARLVTESRFDDDLRAVGLVAPKERGILNIDIRDPGGNLLEGFTPERPRAEQPLTLMAKSAISGEAGTSVEGYNDYRGVPVLGVWLWDEKLGIGMATEINMAEVAQGSEMLRGIFLWTMGIMATLAVGLSGSLLWIRSRADAALHEQEEHVQLLLDSTAEAIYGVDLEGRCTFVNPSCLKMLGYASASELLGKDMHEQIHHSHRDGTPCLKEKYPMGRVLREGVRSHLDDEVSWRSDGSSFPMEYWAHPVIRDRVIVGAVVTFLDITKRKEAEQAVAVARATLEARVEERTTALSAAKTAALNMMRDADEARKQAESAEDALALSNELLSTAEAIGHIGSWRLDLEANELTWSDEEYRIFGVEPGTGGLTYETFLQAVHPDDREMVDRIYTKAINNHEPYELVHRVLKPNGALRVVHSQSREIVDASGKTIVSIGMSHDITERNEAEEKLKKTLRDLEAFNKAAVGRELRMVELKREVNGLSERSGESQRYDLSFADSSEEREDGSAET